MPPLAAAPSNGVRAITVPARAPCGEYVAVRVAV